MLEPIENVNVAAADGANNFNKNFEYGDYRHILPLIPVHINATGGSPHRKLCIEEQLGVIRRRGRNRNVIPQKEIRKRNQEKWKSESGYHMRSIVESVFSVFKNTFDEYIFFKDKRDEGKRVDVKGTRL